MGKIVNFALILTMLGSVLLTRCGDDRRKAGASSEEKAVQNFIAAYLDADIEGVLSASAPNEFWDYLIDQSGLTTERLFYQLGNFDDANEFLSNIDEGNTYYEIEKKIDVGKGTFSFVNHAIQNAGIEEKVEEVYEVEINYFSYGLIYRIDEKWYYGPEWFIEDALRMAYRINILHR